MKWKDSSFIKAFLFFALLLSPLIWREHQRRVQNENWLELENARWVERLRDERQRIGLIGNNRARGQNEVVWVTSFSKLITALDTMGNIMKDYVNPPSSATKSEWIRALASFSNSIHDYYETSVPPSLSEAGRLTDQLIVEAEQAIDNVQPAVETGSATRYYEALHHLENSKNLVDMVEKEIKRANTSSSH